MTISGAKYSGVPQNLNKKAKNKTKHKIKTRKCKINKINKEKKQNKRKTKQKNIKYKETKKT